MTGHIEELSNEFDEHAQVLKDTRKLAAEIEKAAAAARKAVSNGKLLICGNGGSAADAQHFSAELVGRFKKERRGFSAIALSTDTSILTSVGNDYGFESVFERQVEALGKKGDALFAISTSGNSENVIRAVKKAKQLGMATISLLGKGGGKMKGMCDIEIIVPSQDTPRIQEMHGLIIHCICGMLE